MGHYAIKGSEARPATLQVLKEESQGYHVRIIRMSNDLKKESNEFISRTLFESCLRTGYFKELQGA